MTMLDLTKKPDKPEDFKVVVLKGKEIRKWVWNDMGGRDLNPEWKKNEAAIMKQIKAELANRRKNKAQEVEQSIKDRKQRKREAEKDRKLAEKNPHPHLLRPQALAPTSLSPHGTYQPWIRPRDPGKPLCIFDDPPTMSDGAREVFDNLSQKIPDPDALGLTPEKIFMLVRYCYVQANLVNNHFDTVQPEWEKWSTKLGHAVMYPNPQFSQWLAASKHMTYLHHQLFDKDHAPLPKDDDENGSKEDEGKVTAKHFPASMRDAATAAARLTEGQDISNLMPYGVRIGDKIKE